MDKIKAIWSAVDGFIFTICGITLIDLIPAVMLSGFGILDSFERWAQLILIIGGNVLLVLRYRHKKRMDAEALEGARLDNEMKKQQLEALARKNGHSDVSFEPEHEDLTKK